MSIVDGTDARSITRILKALDLNLAVQTENVEKFVDRSKQANNQFLFTKIANIRTWRIENKYNYPTSTRSIVDEARKPLLRK